MGESATTKGYWLASIDVEDDEKYRAYVEANAAAFSRYGACFLVRSGKAERVEGQARKRLVVIEFPDYETALACYHSPEYAAAKALREGASTGEITVIEGYAGPQPGGR